MQFAYITYSHMAKKLSPSSRKMHIYLPPSKLILLVNSIALKQRGHVQLTTLQMERIHSSFLRFVS